MIVSNNIDLHRLSACSIAMAKAAAAATPEHRMDADDHDIFGDSPTTISSGVHTIANINSSPNCGGEILAHHLPHGGGGIPAIAEGDGLTMAVAQSYGVMSAIT